MSEGKRGTHRLLVLSPGSFEASVVGRNAGDRLRASAVPAVFEHVEYVFFPTDVDGGRHVEPNIRVREVAGSPAPSPLSRLRWINGASRIISGFHAIRSIADAARPDVVATVDPFLSGTMALRLARERGIPLVVILVSNYRLSYQAGGMRPLPMVPAPASFALEARVLSKADRVLTDTRHYRDYAVERGAAPERVRVIPRYADPVFRQTDPDPAIWGRLQIPDPRPLLYVGRLSPEKYAMDLLACFVEVKASMPGRHLVVIGGDGSQREAFLAGARDAGIGDAVHLVTGLDPASLATAMASAGVFLATHAGYALLEGAWAGAPVVAYDHEWHSEILTDRTTGRLVPFRDSQGMARAALELLVDPGLARRFGDALRDEARRRFSVGKTMRALEEAYREVLEETR